MSLRARLLVSVGCLLAIALIVSGALVVGFTRASLIDQLDDELRSASTPRTERPRPRRDDDDPTGRRIAYLLLDANGDLLDAVPSGFASAPDPLPSLPELRPGALAGLIGRIVQRPSTDGSLFYRVLIDRGPTGTIRVLAAPLRAVDAPVGLLVRNLILVGLTVLGVALLVGWIVVRRDLRPLERIAATAGRIASGELSQRVDLPHDRSEVGRVGAAFDSMLDQIQSAFEEQRAALVAKERSESRLRQFVANASHELRTPLTALRGYSDLYQAGGLSDRASLDQAMARIGTESRRMATLVEDLLLLARLDQGRPLRREPVDLSAVVTDALGDARAIEPGRLIDERVEPGVRVVGDEDRLRQVIGNLLANVRVHTPPSADLAVSMEASDGSCVLRVVDRGPGIDQAHAERIFDRFYRADGGRSRDRGGSGLGLSIVASIVEAHGGSVAYSPTPQGGATFTVRLPSDEHTGAAVEPPTDGHVGASAGSS
jgi:two-component system OmpR family sensor kinase